MKGLNTNYQLKLAIKRMKTLEFAMLTRNSHYLKIKERWLARAMTSTKLLSPNIQVSDGRASVLFFLKLIVELK